MNTTLKVTVTRKNANSNQIPLDNHQQNTTQIPLENHQQNKHSETYKNDYSIKFNDESWTVIQITLS